MLVLPEIQTGTGYQRCDGNGCRRQLGIHATMPSPHCLSYTHHIPPTCKSPACVFRCGLPFQSTSRSRA
jgi:hypothetical protein